MPSEVTDSIFYSGQILMPLQPTKGIIETTSLWGDSMVVSILIVAFTILAIANLKNFVMIVPSLYETFMRAKGSANLETRNTLIRARTICALVLMGPFCLIADRFNLLPIQYLQHLSPEIRIAATMAIFLAFLFLRLIIGWQIEPKYKGHDAWGIGRRASHGFFIIMTVFELLAIGILNIIGVGDLTIKKVLFNVIGLVYAVYVFRRYQILSMSCQSFTIILYLCTLEIFPVGLLFAAARLF